VRGHRGSHSLSSLLEEMNAAIDVLERSGDDEMLARALISRGWIWHWLGKAAIATAHGSRAMELAAGASARAIEAEAAGLVVAGMRWGPTPWTELSRFIDERLASGEAWESGRMGTSLLDHRGIADAAVGRFDEARARYAELEHSRTERGMSFFIHTMSQSTGQVELLAGDPA